MLHHLTPPAQRCHRHAAADHFAQHRDVRHDVVNRLRAVQGDAKAGHHFIKDAQCAVFGTERTHGAEKLLRAGYQIHVAGDRLDNHAGDLVTVLLESVVQLLWIIEVEHQCVLRDFGRHTGGAGVAECQKTGTGFHQQ